ncbi:hypothetical protein [Bradyrhizobium sp. 930_D9_N1_4]|uniref:hypothetical protein n=1 Tax=Bradyrhizobium sp. 930_D9_N1_4 TaxID=3240374 RepID=UPI003F8BFEFC
MLRSINRQRWWRGLPFRPRPDSSRGNRVHFVHWIAKRRVWVELVPDPVIRQGPDEFPLLVRTWKNPCPVPLRHDVQIVASLGDRAKDVAGMENMIRHRGVHDRQSVVVHVLPDPTQARDIQDRSVGAILVALKGYCVPFERFKRGLGVVALPGISDPLFPLVVVRPARHRDLPAA